MCENFPFGVKSTYRAYSADRIIEIVGSVEDGNCGIMAQEYQVLDYPDDGFHILTSLPPPDLIIPAAKFAPGARAIIETVIRKMIARYEWVAFGRDLFPPTDEIADYLLRLNVAYIDVPLYKQLFSSASFNVSSLLHLIIKLSLTSL